MKRSSCANSAAVLLAAAGLSACLGPVRRGPAPSAPAALPSPFAPAGAAALVPAEMPPDFLDDLDRRDLALAVRHSLRYYRGLPADRTFFFGVDAYSAAEMAEGLDRFQEGLSRGDPDLADRVRREFVAYRSTGVGPAGDVVFSAYYEHALDASLVRTATHAYPLYGRPADLAEETASDGTKRIGRRAEGGWRPYWSRAEIDVDGRLAGRGLEIAWAADPFEVFILQVQGSGWLRLPDGRRVRVRYAGNNGLPYKSVGGMMIERGLIPRERFSREALRAYLRDHPRERPALLAHNPRYVFFQIDETENKTWAFGSLNLPLTPGRSVAVDHALFPPGALGWMETDTKNMVARFIVNQDEGGAIKGPGRVDLFVGGPETEERAVGFWEKGRLYFLAPRRGGTAGGVRPAK